MEAEKRVWGKPKNKGWVAEQVALQGTIEFTAYRVPLSVVRH